ncbi:M28 family peptidase [Hymenobacter sp. YC55]|uniref:M28 family metallopeptidase n=1 Tax=Hymenobacter sp. YC55 TaxID=3034019 RepID=UPI0023F7BB06|nr:M28 family peptidase [Hymenobacter sp. YC55]MDF7812903.1 M28 family peptidase [Hymenobacter sp. YC55]
MLSTIRPFAPVLAQDMPRVRRTIQDLTAPDMQGRGYVRNGDLKAADYIRSRFRQLNLQPLTPNYTQAFLLDVNTFPGQLKLKLRSKTGHFAFPLFGGYHHLRPGVDFIASPNSGSGRVGGFCSAAVVTQLDTTVFSDLAAQQRFLQKPLHRNGIAISARYTRQISTLPIALRQHLESAAFMLTIVPKLTASLAPTQSQQPRLDVLESAWTKATTATHGKESPSVALRVDAELKQNYQAQNLVAYIPGQIRPDSFLVVTAHYDHLGTMGKHAYFPGANDNASGTAMLLELAAFYARAENKPAYSVVFIAFGAEEAGLIGSSFFVNHPLVPLDRIRFLVNLDLLGTGSEGVTVVNGRELPGQFQLLQRLNEARQAVPSLAARGRAANSDHFPFSERGVPAFFLYTRGGIAAYHDVQDRAETLPLTAFASVFVLISDFLNALGAHPISK